MGFFVVTLQNSQHQATQRSATFPSAGPREVVGLFNAEEGACGHTCAITLVSEMVSRVFITSRKGLSGFGARVQRNWSETEAKFVLMSKYS